jgi:hypothetical protein
MLNDRAKRTAELWESGMPAEKLPASGTPNSPKAVIRAQVGRGNPVNAPYGGRLA